jgi:trichohyalin
LFFLLILRSSHFSFLFFFSEKGKEIKDKARNKKEEENKQIKRQSDLFDGKCPDCGAAMEKESCTTCNTRYELIGTRFEDLKTVNEIRAKEEEERKRKEIEEKKRKEEERKIKEEEEEKKKEDEEENKKKETEEEKKKKEEEEEKRKKEAEEKNKKKEEEEEKKKKEAEERKKKKEEEEGRTKDDKMRKENKENMTNEKVEQNLNPVSCQLPTLAGILSSIICFLFILFLLHLKNQTLLRMRFPKKILFLFFLHY